MPAFSLYPKPLVTVNLNRPTTGSNLVSVSTMVVPRLQAKTTIETTSSFILFVFSPRPSVCAGGVRLQR